MRYDAVLGPDDVLAERPFCDPGITAREAEIMRAMAVRERELLRSWPRDRRVLRERDGTGRRLLLVVPDADRLREAADPTAVGFFSRPREGVDHTILFKLEDELVEKMGFYGELGLLSYFDLELESGRFGNLILFSTPDVPEPWYRDTIHQYAVDLSPRHYHEVRIHKGTLHGRLLDPDADIEIERTKYFGFETEPPWRGLRQFASLGQAG
jgi:hypothetical protein